MDDRLAIIGSANVNERSQRGDRDSELAAVIRDTDMLDWRVTPGYEAAMFSTHFGTAPWRESHSRLVGSLIRFGCG